MEEDTVEESEQFLGAPLRGSVPGGLRRQQRLAACLPVPPAARSQLRSLHRAVARRAGGGGRRLVLALAEVALAHAQPVDGHEVVGGRVVRHGSRAEVTRGVITTPPSKPMGY